METKTPTLTAAQKNILTALNEGATITRERKGRFLTAANGTRTRIHDNTDILPALIVWAEEMKASNPEWRVWADFTTLKEVPHPEYEGSTRYEDYRTRGPFLPSLPRALEMAREFRRKDTAKTTRLTLRFPNGMNLSFTHGSGIAWPMSI